LDFKKSAAKAATIFSLIQKQKTTVVPIHNNETIGVGLIKEILRDIELSAEEYERLRGKM